MDPWKPPFKKKTHLCALLEVIGSTSGHIVTTIDDLFLRREKDARELSDIGAAFIPEGVRVFFPNSTGMCNRIHGKSTEREGFGIVGGGGGKRYLEQVARGKSGEKGAFGPLGEPIGPWSGVTLEGDEGHVGGNAAAKPAPKFRSRLLFDA